MLAERRGQASLHKRIKELFEDVSVWTTPFTVYGREDWADSFTGIYPWVFIVSADPRPDFRLDHLPVIIIETRLDVYDADELGGSDVGILFFNYHIFADSAAKRDDMVGSILAHHGHLPLYDFNGETPVLLGEARLIPSPQGLLWSQHPITMSPYMQDNLELNQAVVYGRIVSSAVYMPILT